MTSPWAAGHRFAPQPHLPQPPEAGRHLGRTALECILAERGMATRLAEALEISKAAIFQWKANGVPAERVLDVERITGVARQKIRPDIYPE